MPVQSRTSTTYTQEVVEGENPWLNTSNIEASDNAYSTSTCDLLTVSTNQLQPAGYGFSLPFNAVVRGIQFSMERKASHSNATDNIQDGGVSVFKPGAGAGANRAVAINWPLTDETRLYGSTTDLFGLTWQPSDINGALFGPLFYASYTGSGIAIVTASVDFVLLSVYYTAAGGPGSGDNYARLHQKTKYF